MLPPTISLDFTYIFILIFAFLLTQHIWRDPECRATIKKFLNKAKGAFDDHHGGGGGGGGFPGQQQRIPMQDGQSTIQPPTPADVTRYRYHHGANVGSVFIMEKWLTGSMFPEHAQGSSELAAVEGWVKQEGIDQARQRFERHWREYVSDGDLDWLRDHGKELIGRCRCRQAF
ncbi:Glucan 1,3-beta-glucosidase 3 [Friedmanniomyces endolithicus]|nr:Glucan 1,3-beta-glucosidase 3 [Friedmanniomyces endolithicus]